MDALSPLDLAMLRAAERLDWSPAMRQRLRDELAVAHDELRTSMAEALLLATTGLVDREGRPT